MDETCGSVPTPSRRIELESNADSIGGICLSRVGMDPVEKGAREDVVNQGRYPIDPSRHLVLASGDETRAMPRRKTCALV